MTTRSGQPASARAPRLGLCCTFLVEPIRFRTTTAAYIGRQSRREGREKLASLCRENALALRQALAFCARSGIGSFRVLSQVLPLRTHPDFGYRLESLPGGPDIVRLFESCGAWARSRDLRLTFHPDQFVVLSSPREAVVASSIAEIDHQAEVAEWIGADVITLHGGGVYGDRAAALGRLRRNVRRLSRSARGRLALENDDRCFTPMDLIGACRDLDLPLVYDVHHHRCLPDELTEREASVLALGTWGAREPLFHISSPLGNWRSSSPRGHADYIDPADFPRWWEGCAITVEVEAKAKERAVLRLARDLERPRRGRDPRGRARRRRTPSGDPRGR